MNDSLFIETERERVAREFVCKFIMQIFLELKGMDESPESYDNDSEIGIKRPWKDSNMHQMYICIYDIPDESPENRKAVFRSLCEKYALRLNYSLVFRKLDPMYRSTLRKVNDIRRGLGLELYPYP